ncbi:uncharacterized protein LOC111359648 [Spodoptera litura]|uniref:Uncharacterized protein LOC111359648 n=1 Tax=Spodoptera litura TaxID=69820 RepID=A0A9J7EN45_SPOLT|nr:uncharacterized protein LOC111359648 [Spodoptera litura]
MWHILWIPVLVPTMIIRSNCDNNRTHSDVYVQYSGHAEADEADLPETIPYTTKKTTTTTAPTTKPTTTAKTIVLTVTTPNITVKTSVETTAPTTETTTTTTTIRPVTTTTVKMSEEQTDAVIFLPDVRTGRRDDGYIDGIHIKDLQMKPLLEVMNNKFHEEKLVDDHKDGIVFVAGKNGEIDTDKKQDTNANYNSNQAYCQNMYTGGLWVNHTKKSLDVLRVQYNNAFRMLLRLPPYCSASEMFAKARTDGFHAILRKKTASLLRRLRDSQNSILSTVAES